MTASEDREQTLIDRIVRGETHAMKEFYDAYSGYFTAICSRYVFNRDDVKDVLQDSFIKMFKGLSGFRYRGAGSLRAWASRIVVNEALTFLRKHERMELVTAPVWDLPEMPDDDDPDFDDIPISAIQEMIRSLPVGYRTVFNLYVFEQKTHKEIGTILSITENTSASQLHRAKAMLVKEINRYRTEKRVSYGK